MGSARHPTVVLVGNPNVGKTTLFNALSGLRAKTANYPGITVDMRQATVTLTARPAARAQSINSGNEVAIAAALWTVIGPFATSAATAKAIATR